MSQVESDVRKFVEASVEKAKRSGESKIVAAQSDSSKRGIIAHMRASNLKCITIADDKHIVLVLKQQKPPLSQPDFMGLCLATWLKANAINCPAGAIETFANHCGVLQTQHSTQSYDIKVTSKRPFDILLT